ncbi:MAG: sulfatase-like hydrolase/transferase [Chloroflexota bacterium]|nr:sulfatase-like hydrolase/transferase [Chloroflexota bacterium]
MNRLARCTGPVALASLLVASGTMTALAADEPSAAEAPRPNIVMIMIDDANPHDGRLWSAPYMPNLDELIVSRGIRFTDFHGEVPLCGPSRANLLTGQHAHNSGGNSNNGEQLDVSTTIATELDEAGYHTAYVGKYLNGYRKFSPQRYDPPGWSDFDVINSNQGKYFWYQIRDRDGNISQHKTDEADYSTDVIADIAVERIREAPDDQPLFTLIAPYTPHEPNLPAPRHAGDPRCADIEPWAPPNYDEADVSDKPDYIRDAKPLGDDGFDLTAHCESLLSVDELIGRVGEALEQEGRLDDTVFVFIGDNGMTWGEHRRVAKVSPYATPMPAYAAWPAGRGVEPRDDATTLSMIDFAPTFCELGGCEMGPYPNGQEAADGLGFASLLFDEPMPYLRESLLHTVPSGGDRPVWWSIRTSADHPAGRWHYIENRDGFLELYDISGGLCYEWSEGAEGDPCEMSNLLAGDVAPEMAALAETLSAELAELKVEVAPEPKPRRPAGS